MTNHTQNSQAREYQLTINNPAEKGFGHERIKKVLASFPTLQYFCLCDEIGKEGTLHTHIYVRVKNPIRFSTMKNRFPSAHIERSLGTAEENREYIRKEGKWATTEKKETNLSDTFEEWGELPQINQGERTDLEELFEMIEAGISTAEILRKNPNNLRYLSHIERTRQILKEEEFRNTWRNIECTYVYGETNTNKTRSCLEKYGYENVYRITNYTGNAVWDGYRGQDVVIFEEFRSQILISEMLVWLEGYPNNSLRARYADKTACYTKVYIISNIPLEAQYPNIQKDSPETWCAFLRRIQSVVHHRGKSDIIGYNSVENYLKRNEEWQALPQNEENPFDKKDEEKSENEVPFL